MKFKSFKGKSVFVDGEIVVFKDGTYETEDKRKIEVLKTLSDVESLQEKKSTSSK